jgi:hypothetical protein
MGICGNKDSRLTETVVEEDSYGTRWDPPSPPVLRRQNAEIHTRETFEDKEKELNEYLKKEYNKCRWQSFLSTPS